jgi:hypothetical protein
MEQVWSLKTVHNILLFIFIFGHDCNFDEGYERRIVFIFRQHFIVTKAHFLKSDIAGVDN